MRESIRELSEDISKMLDAKNYNIKYKPSTRASFTIKCDYGIGEEKIKKLTNLCKKDNLNFYIVSKLFTTKLTVYLCENEVE